MILKRKRAHKAKLHTHLVFLSGSNFQTVAQGNRFQAESLTGWRKESSDFGAPKTAKIWGADYQRRENHREEAAETEPPKFS